MTIKECAKKYGVTPQTVRRWMYRGYIDYMVTVIAADDHLKVLYLVDDKRAEEKQIRPGTCTLPPDDNPPW